MRTEVLEYGCEIWRRFLKSSYKSFVEVKWEPIGSVIVKREIMCRLKIELHKFNRLRIILGNILFNLMQINWG